MKRLAKDLWIFDGETVSFYCCPFTTRMTVIRLHNGDLWLHSPITYSEELAARLAELGNVKYLVAPNHLHHLYLPEWIEHYPEASLSGTDEVIRKRDDLHFAHSLNAEQEWPWREEIDQLLVSGSTLMQECVFFHRPTRTLIVTDLIENFPPEHFTGWQRLLAKSAGILAPNGKTPLDWRLSFKKAEVQEHIREVNNWQPDRIVMAHGDIVRQDASEFLQRSFRWVW
ncbi:DUF4336 domain-containing protein [Photobacterium sp. SDRW27]|uniref:DUF4336 domain-containing protein n=1 Tax=Photobacterium obscurum TaxID=2829490 RepID=UPI002243E220|nr:DUF4336 domain-containing protein [Photobacterium obscurum]MCW8331536.1 DUF4336 domain-containing protein [Photobacterium obscurum]